MFWRVEEGTAFAGDDDILVRTKETRFLDGYVGLGSFVRVRAFL